MKKGILAIFMVALMLVTIVSAVTSANDISSNKETIEVEETEDTYTLPVVTIIQGLFPEMPEARIPDVLVTIKVEGEEENRVKRTGVDGYCEFSGMPTGKGYTLVSAQKRFWKLYRAGWWTAYQLFVIEMERKWSWTVNNPFIEQFPFIERFPLLNLLLQRLRI